MSRDCKKIFQVGKHGERERIRSERL